MQNEILFCEKPLILITGFGPFINHPVNASWEAVKLMNKDEIERRHDVELVQLEIPVLYEAVDEFIPSLWNTHTPKLVIHVGVSREAQQLTLEMQAHKKGYRRLDYTDKCPSGHTCPSDGAIRMNTQINVEKICSDYNAKGPSLSAISSKDAGRYLCEYIYYRSLCIDRNRTLFIHVPDIHNSPSERTAKALEDILDLCLEQVNLMDKTDELSCQMEKLGNGLDENT